MILMLSMHYLADGQSRIMYEIINCPFAKKRGKKGQKDESEF